MRPISLRPFSHAIFSRIRQASTGEADINAISAASVWLLARLFAFIPHAFLTGVQTA